WQKLTKIPIYDVWLRLELEWANVSGQTRRVDHQGYTTDDSWQRGPHGPAAVRAPAGIRTIRSGGTGASAWPSRGVPVRRSAAAGPRGRARTRRKGVGGRHAW